MKLVKVVGTGTTIGSNVSKLRTQLGLTQAEFIKKIKDVSGGEYDMKSVASLSALETGRRLPSVRDVISICKVFGVKIEELCGLTYLEGSVGISEQLPKDSPQIGTSIPNYGRALPNNMIPSYDGMPVYVISKSNAFKEGWAILNNDRKTLVFKDTLIPINNVDMDIYTYPPKENDFASGQGCKPLSLNGLKGLEHVWVEMLCHDLYTKGRYNGWYRHNEYKECLVNEGNGLTLPYSGLGISFNAFRINSDKVM